MAPSIAFAQVVIDCREASSLGGFYAALLDRPLVEESNDFFAFIPPGADPPFPGLMFLQVPEPRSGKNRVHIDLLTDDKATAVARALELGATTLGDFDEYGAVWTTLTDPEGNVFDIAARPDPERSGQPDQ
jgi:hypothetical protein